MTAIFPLPTPPRRPLGPLMCDLGTLSAGDLAKASALQARQDARFGDILLAHDMVSEPELYHAIALQYGVQVADLNHCAPDSQLIDRIGAQFCLRHAILPLRRAGSVVIIACARPETFASLAPELRAAFGPVRMAVAAESDLHAALLRARKRMLAEGAESCVALHESCRDWRAERFRHYAMAAMLGAIIVLLLAPMLLLYGLVFWAVLTLALNAALKTAAAVAQTRWARPDAPRPDAPRAHGTKGLRKLPMISIMVPLFHEQDIASKLVKRLGALSYPRELLDICLVVEEDDLITQNAIAATQLPRWMRQIIVPYGTVKTKPRALNFALGFCRGTIVGVYDAEDAPAPDQLHKIARRFHDAPQNVACLQGVLDFYNARTNWLARCFTIEYATWFRLILPGLERLGLVVPLGGTTLFFRRHVLEELGGWDAHNVTEDADLGIRLARHGYKTELIHTITQEEANCRAWPWVKQRSRWLKGYMMTWVVHMRAPRVLWRDLGAWRFLGVQLLFLGTLSQFLLAPLLWSFWLLPLGLWHPLRGMLPDMMFIVIGALFVACELVNICTALLAISGAGPRHRRLWPWIACLQVYFPLAALAAYKGLMELLTRPFYWDKTQHGLHDEMPDETSAAGSAPNAQPATAALAAAALPALPDVPAFARGVLRFTLAPPNLPERISTPEPSSLRRGAPMLCFRHLPIPIAPAASG